MKSDDPSYWATNARRYDRATLLLNRRFGQMATHVADLLSGTRRVLEVAAGTGLVTEHLAPVVEHLVATDRTLEMLTILRGRLADAGLSRVTVAQTDAMALLFEDESFDAVVMANLLHLLPEPGRALEEAHRVLRPGGQLIAPTFCHDDTAIAHLASRILGLTGFPVVTRFAGGGLAVLVGAHGFDVVEQARFAGVLPLRLVVGKRR